MQPIGGARLHFNVGCGSLKLLRNPVDERGIVKWITKKKWLLLNKRHHVCHGLLKQNRIRRLSETTELIMEVIHHQVHQFMHGTRNLWRQRVLDKGRSGRPRTSEENIDRVRLAFQCSPTKSICTLTRQFRLPCSTVQKALHKFVWLHAYKVQLLQALRPNDKPRWKEFAVNMCERIPEDETFPTRVCFTHETICHVSGKLNTHNVRIWGSEPLPPTNVTTELCQDSPKANVWHGILCNRVIGPFFFNKTSITENIYLELWTEYVAPQVDDLEPTIIFHQDGAVSHWRLHVHGFLNQTFPDGWIGNDGAIHWPSH